MTASVDKHLRRRRFTVDEYHRMGETGILDEDDRVELLEGAIVEMTPIGSRHVGLVMRIQRLLHERVADDARVSVQNPLRLGRHSEPEPDLVVLRERDDDYFDALPAAEDALLVIEVSETSIDRDREVKVPLYARHDIPEVWIVDLERNCIERYVGPTDEGYADGVEVAGDRTLRIPGPSDVTITPDEIFDGGD